jgi:hypothetical protein
MVCCLVNLSACIVGPDWALMAIIFLGGKINLPIGLRLDDYTPDRSIILAQSVDSRP